MVKLTPHRLLLPCVWLNTLFGNQLWSPTFAMLGQVFYWFSVLMAGLLAAKTFGRWVWPYLLILLIAGSRVASILDMPGFRMVYLGSTMLLFVVAGVALHLKFPQVLQAQVRTFILLSLPVMFMQVVGVGDWTQMFNTLYITGGDDVDSEIARPEVHLLPLLFSTEEDLLANRAADFFEFLSMQSRPPGLTHSSAMLAAFILAGTAVHLGRMRSKKLTWQDVLLACVAVMAGAKMALLGFLLLVIVAWCRADSPIRRRLATLMLVTGAALAMYIGMFPAVAQHNLGSGAFEVSFFTRAADAIVALAPNLVYLPELADVVSTYAAVLPGDREDVGGLSGLVTLIKVLPFALVGGLLALPWILRGFRHCRSLSITRCRTSELMLLVILIVPFATQLFGSQFYSLCIGVTIMPIALSLSTRLRTSLAQPEAWTEASALRSGNGADNYIDMGAPS